MYSRWRNVFWGALAVVAGFYIIRHILVLVLVEAPRFDMDLIIIAAKRFMAREPVYVLEDGFQHTKPPLLMGIAFPLAWLPHFWVRLIWDLVVFSMPWLILREVLRGERWNWRPLALTAALMYPFWYKEAEFGQYNLFNFWLMVVAARWLRSERSWLQVAAGACAAFTVVLKPTQLYLLPWVFLAATGLPAVRARILRAASGGAALGLALAASYSILRSPGELIADHREWSAFLPKVSALHLMGANNYGIPTLLARLDLGWLAFSPAFVPVTLALTCFVAWRLRDRRELSLHVCALLMLAFSPMAWRANFGVFAGLAYGLAVWLERNLREVRAWVGIGGLLVFAKASEYWLGVRLAQWFGFVAAPLWLVALAIFCLGRLRGREERTAG